MFFQSNEDEQNECKHIKIKCQIKFASSMSEDMLKTMLIILRQIFKTFPDIIFHLAKGTSVASA